MDAMLGYRDEREYVGKAAARSDDAANWVPTRITGLLLVAVSALKGTAGRAWWAFRTQHQPQYGPNKTLAIATMAGSLGVQLQKPGAYALGARRPAADRRTSSTTPSGGCGRPAARPSRSPPASRRC